MCGIAGMMTFESSPATVNHATLQKMSDAITHRGPDGGRIWISQDERVGLAFRRLAIIDLSDTAMQPMCNEDGSLWVLFNGEIYNHAQIRMELEKSGGHTWKTDHSDTEVILHAYEEWSIDCIHKFRGMFAIAIWDSKKKKLWLIRDRIGVKPLYFSMNSGKITFASEIKALLQDSTQKREVCEEALYHYLSFLTTPAPFTLFEGIRKLPGGMWMCIDSKGSMEEHRYWDVWEHTTPMSGMNEDEIIHRVIEELRIAVKLRKISDVPVGVFLSGGIDSSTNAALFSEGGSEKVKTFTIGYEGDYKTYQNEMVFARMIAQRVGATYYEKLLSVDDLLDFIPRMVQLQDEPIADPVCVPVYYVSKLARDNGVIVCQVGEGADELFWGYPWWKRMVQLQQWGNAPVPEGIKRGAFVLTKMMREDHPRYHEFLRRNLHHQPVFWGGAEAFTEDEKQRLFSTRLKKKYKGFSSWEAIEPIWQRYENLAWQKSPLNWMTYLDLNMRLPELLLMRVDKMSMGVSLEARVPFLDHRFVEMVMSIPTIYKTHGGQNKYLLKKAVRGLIPDEIIDRKKQGFGVPVYEWFFGRLGEVARAELAEFCHQTDYLDYTEIENLFNRGDGERIWFLLNLALWWKEYIA